MTNNSILLFSLTISSGSTSKMLQMQTSTVEGRMFQTLRVLLPQFCVFLWQNYVERKWSDVLLCRLLSPKYLSTSLLQCKKIRPGHKVFHALLPRRPMQRKKWVWWNISFINNPAHRTWSPTFASKWSLENERPCFFRCINWFDSAYED